MAVAALPVLVALGGNAAVNRVAFHEPGVGVATKRLPVLLARSLADGPARWHLEENCAAEGYAICEVFDGNFSSNLSVILWSDAGLGGASPEQMDRIRAEEPLILRRAFMDYPAEQIWSFAGNAVSQTWTFGMDDFSWSRLEWLPDGRVDTAPLDPDRSRAGLDAIGAAHLAALAAAAGLILLYAARDGLRAGAREREMLFMAVAGLLVNAAIFGGLSVPVDRYQGRVIWIIPVLAALFWLTRRNTRATRVTELVASDLNICVRLLSTRSASAFRTVPSVMFASSANSRVVNGLGNSRASIARRRRPRRSDKGLPAS